MDPEPKPVWNPRELIDANRTYPTDEQRRAAWQAAFADDAGPFRGAFEHAAIGMAIVDLTGRFLKVNPALTQIVGYTEEELLATDFQSVTHPDDLDADVKLARQLMAGEIDHYDLEKRYFHKDGHVVWIYLSASIARDSSGAPCYAISQIQDITARKTAELEATRHLRQMDRLTDTVWSILQVLASTPGEEMYAQVLRIVMTAFESRAGVFLRFADDETLSGPFISPFGSHTTQRSRDRWCDLWTHAVADNQVRIENRQREIDCGLSLDRSLIGPISHDGAALGLFHLGNSTAEYNDYDRDLLARVAAIIGPVLNARMQRDKLTPREAEVMDLIVEGMSQKQIASALNISIQTTAKHRARVLDKLQVRSDVELVHLALQMRLPWPDGKADASIPINWRPKMPFMVSRGELP